MHSALNEGKSVVTERFIRTLNNKIYKHITSSDFNWTRTHNHLVYKRTLNHLAKLA